MAAFITGLTELDRVYAASQRVLSKQLNLDSNQRSEPVLSARVRTHVLIHAASAAGVLNLDSHSEETLTDFSVGSEYENDEVHCLVVVEGQRQGERFELSEAHSIGRDAGCTIQLQDPAVSRVHCHIQVEHGQVMVTDPGSRNGTFVDGVRIVSPTLLEPASRLKVGDHILRHDIRTRREVAREQELAHDIAQARAYVAALIPEQLSTGPVLTSWAFEPCEALGGDLLGYYWLDERRIALYVLDVCGHGVLAAMHSASVSSVLRNRTLPDTDFGAPGSVLERLNRNFQMEEHGGMYFTIWYGVFDTATRLLRYASAGHPPALLLEHGRAEPHKLETKNPPIGALPGGRRFREESCELGAGARLYVFSDGAFELTTDEGLAWTFEEFEKLVALPGGAQADEAGRIHREVRRLARSETLEDDVSILVVTLPRSPTRKEPE